MPPFHHGFPVLDTQETKNRWSSYLQEYQDGVPQADLLQSDPLARPMLQSVSWSK